MRPQRRSSPRPSRSPSPSSNPCPPASPPRLPRSPNPALARSASACWTTVSAPTPANATKWPSRRTTAPASRRIWTRTTRSTPSCSRSSRKRRRNCCRRSPRTCVHGKSRRRCSPRPSVRCARCTRSRAVPASPAPCAWANWRTAWSRRSKNAWAAAPSARRRWRCCTPVSTRSTRNSSACARRRVPLNRLPLRRPPRPRLSSRPWSSSRSSRPRPSCRKPRLRSRPRPNRKPRWCPRRCRNPRSDSSCRRRCPTRLRRRSTGPVSVPPTRRAPSVPSRRPRPIPPRPRCASRRRCWTAWSIRPAKSRSRARAWRATSRRCACRCAN